MDTERYFIEISSIVNYLPTESKSCRKKTHPQHKAFLLFFCRVKDKGKIVPVCRDEVKYIRDKLVPLGK